MENRYLKPNEIVNLKIDKCKILGGGIFGKVYMGTFFEVPVAVKILNNISNTEAINYQSIEDCKREAEIMTMLTDPNCVTFFGYYSTGISYTFVMTLANQGSLQERLNSTEPYFSPSEQKNIAVGILSGLEFLHSKEISHNDIKPPNILFNGLTPLICDFGLSTRLNKDDIHSPYGNALYSPPDKLLDFTCLKKTDDIYSFGIVCYQLVEQVPAIYPEAKEVEELLYLRKANPLQPSPNCPEEFKTLITKCLETKPSDRPTASEGIKLLQASFINGGKIIPKKVQQKPKPPAKPQKISLLQSQPKAVDYSLQHVMINNEGSLVLSYHLGVAENIYASLSQKCKQFISLIEGKIVINASKRKTLNEICYGFYAARDRGTYGINFPNKTERDLCRMQLQLTLSDDLYLGETAEYYALRKQASIDRTNALYMTQQFIDNFNQPSFTKDTGYQANGFR